MKLSVRALLIVGLIAGGTGMLPALSVDLQPGDVVAGVGDEGRRPGEYLVFSETGVLRGTVTDPFAGRTGSTTGCAIRPSATGDTLFATTFGNRDVTRIPVHAAEVVARTVVPSVVKAGGVEHEVEAVESIVFDTAGNYYLGALPPARRSVYEPVPPFAFIFKYSPAHELVATYVVPSERRGADWIDLGSDNRTLYYTSEGGYIHVITPDATGDDPARPVVQVFGRTGDPNYRAIMVHDGQLADPIGGTLYGVRALPPVAGDPERRPSGFVAAHSSGPLRIGADGVVLERYSRPATLGPGPFFSINLTSDAQSFWTGTFQEAANDRLAARAGRLARFHIATGSVTAIVDTGAPAVGGMCIKGEYTAAANVCHERRADGTYRAVPCRIPEYCRDDVDGDGDGRADREDDDCRALFAANRPPFCSAAGPSESLKQATGEFAPITIDHIWDQDGDRVTIAITAILQDEPVGTRGGQFEPDGRIEGDVAWVRAARGGSRESPNDGRVYEITYQVNDGKGGTCGGSVFVGVPHDLGGRLTPVDSGGRWNSITGERVR